MGHHTKIWTSWASVSLLSHHFQWKKKKANIDIIIQCFVQERQVSISPQLPGASGAVVKAQSGIWAVWAHFCHRLPVPHSPKDATVLSSALGCVPEKKRCSPIALPFFKFWLLLPFRLLIPRDRGCTLPNICAALPRPPR